MRNSLLFIFFAVSFSVSAQQWDWAIQENVQKFAVDAAGNIFTQNNSTLKKFNTNGLLQWQKQYNGDLRIKSMIADNAGSLYIAGVFTNFSLDNNFFVSAGAHDIFFCKFNSSGTMIWYKTYGGVNEENAADLHLTNDQKILLCGSVESGTVIGNTNFTQAELFTARFDTNGNLELLIHYFGGNGWEVASDTSGNIFLLGGVNTINDTLNFGNNMTFFGYGPWGHYFIAKFNSSGNILWAKDLGDNYYQPSKNLAVDKAGNFYLAKWRRYQGFDLTKFDGAGNLIWNRNTWGIYGDCNSLCVDTSDSIWLTGNIYKDPFRSLPFIWQFDPASNLTNAIPNLYANGNNIANDNNNNIYVSGTFVDTAVFGNTTLLASSGNYFLAKWRRSANSIIASRSNSEDIETITIFPNPSSGIFHLNSNGNENEIKINIYDVMGNFLFKKIVTKNTDREIDLSGKAQGIYFAEIISDSKRSVKKIILE